MRRRLVVPSLSPQHELDTWLTHPRELAGVSGGRVTQGEGCLELPLSDLKSPAPQGLLSILAKRAHRADGSQRPEGLHSSWSLACEQGWVSALFSWRCPRHRLWTLCSHCSPQNKSGRGRNPDTAPQQLLQGTPGSQKQQAMGGHERPRCA